VGEVAGAKNTVAVGGTGSNDGNKAKGSSRGANNEVESKTGRKSKEAEDDQTKIGSSLE
jgi:hypothetical protein